MAHVHANGKGDMNPDLKARSSAFIAPAYEVIWPGKKWDEQSDTVQAPLLEVGAFLVLMVDQLKAERPPAPAPTGRGYSLVYQLTDEQIAELMSGASDAALSQIPALVDEAVRALLDQRAQTSPRA